LLLLCQKQADLSIHDWKDPQLQLPGYHDHDHDHASATASIKFLRLLWRVLVLPRKQSKLLLLRHLLRRKYQHFSLGVGYTAPPRPQRRGARKK